MSPPQKKLYRSVLGLGCDEEGEGDDDKPGIRNFASMFISTLAGGFFCRSASNDNRRGNTERRLVLIQLILLNNYIASFSWGNTRAHVGLSWMQNRSYIISFFWVAGRDWFRGRGDTEEKIPLELLGGGAHDFEYKFANSEINSTYSF